MTDTLSRRTAASTDVLENPQELRQQVVQIVADTTVVDMHTHLFPPEFGDLCRWGIDDLLTYHYLVAEVLRVSGLRPAEYRALARPAQADLIWDTLFVRNTPLSEATRGVVAVLSALGLDPAGPDLREARDFFRAQRIEDHLSRVLDRARVGQVVMTNDPFDAREAGVWQREGRFDSRFRSALRLDPLLNDWRSGRNALDAAGYRAGVTIDDGTVAAVRRFLDDWIQRMKPLYLAVSLPDDFAWPEEGARGRLISEVVLPTCRDHGLPFAMMIGVRRSVNPALEDAGDGVGRADVSTVHRLCRAHPDNRFLVTMLSRENQHDLCVAARKFANLMPFGCWWFLNNPSIVSEITRERLELLGTSFIAQHSDARVLEQLLYKWPHARRVIAEALADQYAGVVQNGRRVSAADITRDVQRLFAGSFQQWTTTA